MKGKILISQPFMLDDNFKRSVILITEHNEEGTVGFILNKPIEMELASLFDSGEDFEPRFGYGGPCCEDTLHYIHNIGGLLSESIPVFDDLCWCGEFEELRQLIKEGAVMSDNILFFLGYSGWSPGQLDAELETGSWIVSETSVDQLLKGNHETLWKEVLKPLGHTFEIISEIPDSANYN